MWLFGMISLDIEFDLFIWMVYVMLFGVIMLEKWLVIWLIVLLEIGVLCVNGVCNIWLMQFWQFLEVIVLVGMKLIGMLWVVMLFWVSVVFFFRLWVGMIIWCVLVGVVFVCVVICLLMQCMVSRFVVMFRSIVMIRKSRFWLILGMEWLFFVFFCLYL